MSDMQSEFEASDIPRDGKRSAAYHAIADQLAVVERERDALRLRVTELEAALIDCDVALTSATRDRASANKRTAELEAERDCMRPVVNALERISNMPRRSRPDGTFNYGREAIIDIAERAIDTFYEEADRG